MRAAARLPQVAMRAELERVGLRFTEPSVIIHDPVQPAWEGVRVQFPADAGHEFAGMTLAVTQAADGLPALVDPKTGDLLMADDMPLRQAIATERAQRGGQLLVTPVGFEQIPLGPVEIPQGQMDSEQLRTFLAALEAAGFIARTGQRASNFNGAHVD